MLAVSAPIMIQTVCIQSGLNQNSIFIELLYSLDMIHLYRFTMVLYGIIQNTFQEITGAGLFLRPLLFFSGEYKSFQECSDCTGSTYIRLILKKHD